MNLGVFHDGVDSKESFETRTKEERLKKKGKNAPREVRRARENKVVKKYVKGSEKKAAVLEG